MIFDTWVHGPTDSVDLFDCGRCNGPAAAIVVSPDDEFPDEFPDDDEWMGENAADIERLGESITVIVGSRVTRVCANLCVRACNPPQPVRVCSTEEEALAFAREAHERIARRE